MTVVNGTLALKLMTLPFGDDLEMLGRRKMGVCKDECRTIPSPGGKGDREAVDEEWRHLTILNAVKSKNTTFSNVPF